MHINVDEMLKTMSIDEVFKRIEESEKLLKKKKDEWDSFKGYASAILSMQNNKSYNDLTNAIQDRKVELGDDPLAVAELERQQEIVDDIFHYNVDKKSS